MGLKEVRDGIDDAALAVIRTPIGAPATAVSDTLTVGGNLLRRGANVFKKRSAEIFEAFSHVPFPYKGYEKVLVEDKFGQRWKKRMKNAGTSIGNSFKWTGNTIKNLFVAPVKTVLWYAPAMAVGLTVGNGLDGVKDVVSTTKNFLFNAINPVLQIGRQGKDKKPFAFDELAKDKTITWQEAFAMVGKSGKDKDAKKTDAPAESKKPKESAEEKKEEKKDEEKKIENKEEKSDEKVEVAAEKVEVKEVAPEVKPVEKSDEKPKDKNDDTKKPDDKDKKDAKEGDKKDAPKDAKKDGKGTQSAQEDTKKQPDKNAKNDSNANHVKKKLTKTEIFENVKTQNNKYASYYTNITDWYSEKVDKFMERGASKKEAQEIASLQIQNVLTRIFSNKLSTPGTKLGDMYKNKGDSDGEGAIFLVKKFGFTQKHGYVNYLSHDDMKKYAHSSDADDEKALRVFLDGGEKPGVHIENHETEGLRSSLTKTKIIVDHHPEGPSSAAGMVATILQGINLIPKKEQAAVTKFVQTLDIVDSFLSKAGKVIDVEKDYAKTLVSLSYKLNSEDLYQLCRTLPEDVDAITPIPDKILKNFKASVKGKNDKRSKEKVSIEEGISKKQQSILAGKELVEKKIVQHKYVSIEGKQFLVFDHRDSIANDIRALLSAERGFGTIKVHDNGNLFIVHDEGIPVSIKKLGLTIRDIILLVDENSQGVDSILSQVDEGKGKDYLNSVFDDIPAAKAA